MPKRRLLGCSFPVLIGISVVFLVLLVVSFASGPLGAIMFPGVELPSWLSVPQPEPKLPAEAVFHPFGFPITNTMIAAWITMIFVVGLSYAITRRMKLVPGRLQAAFEFLIGWLYDLCREVAGNTDGRKFFPMIATIFLFVGFNAWLGLLPGFGSITVHAAEGEVHLLRPASTDINLPLALALISFVFVEVTALRRLGIGYLRKFFDVREFVSGLRQISKGRLKAGLPQLLTGALNIFTGLLEGFSELVRIVSLTIRLFGNMTAGEVLLLVTAFLVPWVLAVPFYGLELLIGYIQALIFAGLTLIFITFAATPHGEEAH